MGRSIGLRWRGSGRAKVPNAGLRWSFSVLVRSAIALSLGISIAVVTQLVSGGVASASTPPTDTSYFVATTSTTTAYEEGYSQGEADAASGQDSLVILDFGGQYSSGGFELPINYENITDAQADAYAEAFGEGYWAGTFTDTSTQVDIVMGTNNDVNANGTTAKHLSSDVSTVWNYLYDNGYGSQTWVEAGDDIEPSYADDYADVHAFLNGMTELDVNFGSADGCPTSGGAGSCLDSWTVNREWWVSTGSSESDWSTPEIYLTAQGDQWANISSYGENSESKESLFYGPCTESGGLSPGTAYSDFSSDLSSFGVGQTMPYIVYF